MKKFSILAGSASKNLAIKLTKQLKAELVTSDLRVFSDGETKITLKKKPKNKAIIIVQALYPPVDTHLIELFSLISKSRELSQEITVIVPYMGYARQDREFLHGEIVTLKVVADLLKSSGVKEIIVVDIHSILGLKYFKIQTKNITAIPTLVKYFKKINLKTPLVVSPDCGGKDRAKSFAKLLKTDYLVLEKKRDRKTGEVTILSSDLNNLVGRDLILVDDMISTGGSIIKATEYLKKEKCNNVYVACTHSLLSEESEKKIYKSGVKKIISTNTIPGNTAIVDISKIIVQAIK